MRKTTKHKTMQDYIKGHLKDETKRTITFQKNGHIDTITYVTEDGRYTNVIIFDEEGFPLRGEKFENITKTIKLGQSVFKNTRYY